MSLADVPEPVIGPGQILVEVAVAGVNFRDTTERRGIVAGPTPPFIPGVEGVGQVLAVGKGVSRLLVGERVAWMSGQGSYAERIALDAWRAVLVPDGLSDEVAAAVLLQGVTADYLITSCRPVKAGDPIVVHAAAGGVGSLLTQLAARRGALVLATASTARKRSMARKAGSTAAVPYKDLVAAAREMSDGQGVAAVFDGVGGPTISDDLAALRPRGHLVLYGQSGGPVEQIDVAALAAKGLWFTRPSLRFYADTPRSLHVRAKRIFSAVASGNLQVNIGARYGLAEAPAAHGNLESRSTTGKSILIVRAGRFPRSREN